MADEDLDAGVENVSLDEDDGQSEKAGAEADTEGKKKTKPLINIKLPFGLTPITFGVAVLALLSAGLSVNAFLKTQSYKSGLETALESARDPANLTYYQRANLTFLEGQTYSPNTAVVILGSDLGHHWSMLDVLREDAVVNRSIAKQSFAQMMLRFEQDVLGLDPRAVVFMPPLEAVLKPDWLLAQTRVLGEVAEETGIIPVITTVAPVPRGDERIEGGYIGRIRSTNRSLRALAEKRGWPCVDFYEILAGNDHFLKPSFAGSELWPNAHGYGAMTRAIESLLDSLPSVHLVQDQPGKEELRSAMRE